MERLRLLNRYEELTLGRLQAVTDRYGARVYAKIRIADVLRITQSGLDDTLYGFALKSHFDFVISDDRSSPLFAVEFDGPLHSSCERQKLADARKDRICEFAEFPLLRINARYVDAQYRGHDLLSYLTHIWFLHDGFERAQESGHIPLDEPFFPSFILSSPDSKRPFPYWISLDAQLEIKNLMEEGRIRCHAPSYWTGVDSGENYRSIVWLEVGENEYLISKTGMRRQLFPIDAPDILWQIAVFDIRKAIDRYLAADRIAIGWEIVRSELDRFESTYEMRCCGTSTKMRKTC